MSRVWSASSTSLHTCTSGTTHVSHSSARKAFSSNLVSNGLSGYNVDFFIWCMIELASAVICGCLPTMRPLMKKFFGSRGSIKESWDPRSTGTDASWVGGSQGEPAKLRKPPPRNITPLQAPEAMVAAAPLPTPSSLKTHATVGTSTPLQTPATLETPSSEQSFPTWRTSKPRHFSMPSQARPLRHSFAPSHVPAARQSFTPAPMPRQSHIPSHDPTSRQSFTSSQAPASRQSFTPSHAPADRRSYIPSLAPAPLHIPTSRFLPKRGSRPTDWFADLPSPTEDSKTLESIIRGSDASRRWFPIREPSQRHVSHNYWDKPLPPQKSEQALPAPPGLPGRPGGGLSRSRFPPPSHSRVIQIQKVEPNNIAEQLE